ncbi:MAG: response regulator, partial [Lentisphaerae bacterium]|nr:response regulator [Lentisphaerota bacterium]
PDRQAEVLSARQTAVTGTRRVIDYPMRSRNGGNVPVRETNVPVRDQEGQITSIIGIIDFMPEAANTQTEAHNTGPADNAIKARGASRGRILLADDDALLVCSCTRYLAHAGFGTTPAYNGMEALELFNKQPDDFDLVIIDMIMPRVGGVEVVTQLRKIKPEVKIIGISGYSQDGSEWDMFRNQVSAWLAKPFEPDQLVQLAAKFINS